MAFSVNHIFVAQESKLIQFFSMKVQREDIFVLFGVVSNARGSSGISYQCSLCFGKYITSDG